MRDSDRAVRRTAAFALAELGDPIVASRCFTVQSRTVAADEFGLIAFREFQVKAGTNATGGSRRIITPMR